jgi:hypothetical protein
MGTIFISHGGNLTSKLKAKNHFLRSVLRQKKLFILGDENELTGLVS